VFTKDQIGAVGELESLLENLHEPMGKAFTDKWIKHDEESCGIEHKLLVGDGHAKIHFECCPSKNGKTIFMKESTWAALHISFNSAATQVSHPALGEVFLPCGRWPPHVDRKKVTLCVPC
jgi:hypothetical protein